MTAAPYFGRLALRFWRPHETTVSDTGRAGPIASAGMAAVAVADLHVALQPLRYVLPTMIISMFVITII